MNELRFSDPIGSKRISLDKPKVKRNTKNDTSNTQVGDDQVTSMGGSSFEPQADFVIGWKDKL